MLLIVHMLALGVGLLVFLGILILRRRQYWMEETKNRKPLQFNPVYARRPASWLAIRTANPESVQAALGLLKFAPCSWSEGMVGEHEYYISPRVNGWVVVTGLALPDPADDVDECFRFLAGLSRKLGHVQFFYTEKFTHHHAWARMDDGCVTRAYAWAGKTLWNQGTKTLPEIMLRLQCFEYGDETASAEIAEANAERVSMLAARWSLDPAMVDGRLLDHAGGVAGELPQLY